LRANVIETVVGTIVLSIAISFGFLAYTASKGNVISGYNVYAQFQRIDGLMVGNNVNLNGVLVGQVKEISLNPQNYLAKVTMTIENEVNLPLDTAAQVVSEGFMGGKYINLLPGGKAEKLKEGQEITITQSSVSLEEMLGKYVFSKDDGGGKL
jgi:phospholipid/cholesterol/gamma-HCH transport system substrate-binding protein